MVDYVGVEVPGLGFPAHITIAALLEGYDFTKLESDLHHYLSGYKYEGYTNRSFFDCFNDTPVIRVEVVSPLDQLRRVVVGNGHRIDTTYPNFSPHITIRNTTVSDPPADITIPYKIKFHYPYIMRDGMKWYVS